MKTFTFYIILSAFTIAAHAASTQTERAGFIRQAEEQLRPGTFALFIIPPSTGSLNESVVKGFSLFGGPSRLVKNAARTLLECQKRELDLAVACKSEAKLRVTMIAALKALKEEKLGGMTIYYLLPPNTDLAEMTVARGANPIFQKSNQSREITPVSVTPPAPQEPRY